MKRQFFLFLASAVIISSCGMPAAAPTLAPLPTSTPKIQPTDTPLPTVASVCISAKATQNDINRALSYTEETFDELEWGKTYEVVEGRVSVTWLNNPLGAVVYLEMIIFPCGYEEPDLNKYYSDENWAAIFQNYESFKMIDQCRTDDGLRLYEFETQNQGFEYEVRYWVDNDTDTRIISTMIVFPLEEESSLDEYSARLFPDYSTCP